MKTSNIINIILVMVVVFLLTRPKPVENNNFKEKMRESQLREDSLVNLINKLQTPKNELKDSIIAIDSVYTNISKDSLRSRINRFRIPA